MSKKKPILPLRPYRMVWWSCVNCWVRGYAFLRKKEKLKDFLCPHCEEDKGLQLMKFKKGK